LGTFFLSLFFNTISQTLIQGLALLGSVMVLLVIIAIGIVFDVIGIASAAANLPPLNARAAKKVPGAKHALILARNSDRVSSFCNDVVGDICGIVSGSAATAIIFSLALNNARHQNYFSIFMMALVASLTVGGKAVGKSIAINYSTEILLLVGRVLYFFRSLLPRRKEKDRSRGK
jgi:CBS domain containing-hemolysin-like protein